MTINFDSLVLGPCMQTFGETNQGFPIGLYKPANGGSFTINGIFDAAYKEIKIKEGEPVTVHMPVFGFRVSDFPNPPSNWAFLQGDQIKLRGDWYVVRECRDDGHGGIKLMLNAVELK
jgi:hypothetical protein